MKKIRKHSKLLVSVIVVMLLVGLGVYTYSQVVRTRTLEHLYPGANLYHAGRFFAEGTLNPTYTHGTAGSNIPIIQGFPWKTRIRGIYIHLDTVVNEGFVTDSVRAVLFRGRLPTWDLVNRFTDTIIVSMLDSIPKEMTLATSTDDTLSKWQNLYLNIWSGNHIDSVIATGGWDKDTAKVRILLNLEIIE